MNFEKFSPYQWFCSFLIACLKPFTVVAETLSHRDVGERYAGLSAFVAMLLLGAEAEFCSANQSSLLWILMAAFVIRMVMLRVAGMRRRHRGDHSIHSHSAGTSVLQLVSARLPPQVIPWIEPFAVMLAGLIVSIINEAVGDFVLWSGAALLAINLIRLSAAYSKKLDADDAQVEQDTQRIEHVIGTPLGVSTVTPRPTPLIEDRAVQPELFPVAESHDIEVEHELSSLLPLKGGAPWKE